MSTKIIKQEKLNNGKFISTVDLGLFAYQDINGEALRYETMVFPEVDDFNQIDQQRYRTIEEALEGHKKLKKKHSNNTDNIKLNSEIVLIESGVKNGEEYRVYKAFYNEDAPTATMTITDSNSDFEEVDLSKVLKND